MEHLGAYCNGTPQVAMFTIFLGDGTCGMFMMPSARDVFWLGFTKYTITGNKLKIKIQNPTGKPIQDKTIKYSSNEHVEATLTPGVEYIQHGSKGNTKFLFVSPYTKFWDDLGGFKKLGEPRLLEGAKDYDAAHEIIQLSSIVINKYGPCFVWA